MVALPSRTLSAVLALSAALLSPDDAGAATPSAPKAAAAALVVQQQDTTASDTARPKPATKGLPMAPARTLDFTVREGSWLSVDVSPDGRTLVFDHLGDLYTLPITGGTATRIMGGMEFEAQPRFSPDGRRIVFVSDRSGGQNLWILSTDGRDTTQLTQGNDNLYTSPEWTPDGDYVVASRTYSPLGGRAKLWLFHTRGGSGTALIDEPDDLKTLGAAFGPDPRWIWYAERTGDWQYNAQFPQYQLAVYDRETGRRSTVSSRYGSAFRPALSPDGRWLVYASRHEAETGLRIRDLESGEERWLAYPVQRDDQESRATLDAYPGYAFTPDSREIVVSYGGGLWRVPVDGSAATEIPFQVDVRMPLGPELDFAFPIEDSPTFEVRQIEDAVPSPDGRRIAFTALDRLYVMDWPSGTPRRLAAGAEGGQYSPAWSPDGRWIAWVSWSDVDGGHLWKAPAAGGDPVRLTRAPAYYTGPAWSPDGARIALTRAPARARREGGFGGGFSEIVWVPQGGGAATLIAPAGGRGGLHFTSDSDRIWAYSSREGLVSFRWDGTDEREHLRVTGFTRQGASTPAPATRIVMAPRGDLALAEVDDHVYVITVPWVGGETPRVSVTNPENAPVPVERLTDIGGQDAAWGADGRTAHWSIGNAHVAYSLDEAHAFADSVEAARAARPDTAGAAADTTSSDAEYRPLEVRIPLTAERDIPRGSLVLRGARVVTMRGDEVIEDADLVIRDNRIAAVGARGSVAVPEGARILDAAGATIVPGFIDPHAHLRPDFGVHTRQPWEYLANLAYGVTTTRDPQTSTTDVLTYADQVRTGAMVGPRIFSTGPGVFGNYRGQAVRDLDHARDLLRRYSDYWGTKYIKMYLAGNRQQRQWLLMAAREVGLLPTTEAGLDFALDLTHAIDGYPGVEHNIPIYPLYDDVVQLFARSGTVNTPTLIVSFGGPFGENWFYTESDVHSDAKLRRFTPHTEIDQKTRRRGGGGQIGWALPEEYVFDDHARFLDDVMDAGGCVGVGSHGQLQGLGFHWELWMVGSGGMTPHEALRAGTLCGARAIGMEADLGSLEAGKLADLVVLEGDPLRDLRATNTIRWVMKNGRLYEGDTLAEIHPRQRALPGGLWREPEPDVAAGVGR